MSSQFAGRGCFGRVVVTQRKTSDTQKHLVEDPSGPSPLSLSDQPPVRSFASRNLVADVADNHVRLRWWAPEKAIGLGGWLSQEP